MTNDSRKERLMLALKNLEAKNASPDLIESIKKALEELGVK